MTVERCSLLLVAATWGLVGAPFAVANERVAEILISAEETEFFESRIRPVLVEHCYECHNSLETAEAGLALDYRGALLDGGDSGAIVVPGDPDQSRLLKTLRHELEGLEMPDGGPKLEQGIIDDFEKWIRDGAPDPRDRAPTADELAEATSWTSVMERRKRWWSFQPIQKQDPPSEIGFDNPIDAFIAAEWREQGIEPAKPADSNTLIRRLYFNLLGFPPSIEELEKWTRLIDQGDRNTQLASLVDHLLESQHFGERWARHWMDWVRYAESHGSEGDPKIDNAWLYRDYLIRALNSDVPYDQLVREHIAGDLLTNPRIDSDRGTNESMIGTAHWRMVFHGFTPTDALEERVRFTDDQIDTFSKAFLGLTVSCARCHHHKFDAISQEDYYSLYGILQSCRPGRKAIETDEILDVNRAKLLRLKNQIRRSIGDEWKKNLKERFRKVAENIPEKREIGNPLDIVHEARRRVENGISFSDAMIDLTRELGERISKSKTRHDDQNIQHWSLSDPRDVDDWTQTGLGVKNGIAKPGDFAVQASGPNALMDIYPSGFYSHLVSNKDAARITSPDFDVAEPAELWLRVFGRGDAMARYVVHDYPRRGTVYAVPKLQSNWYWQRHDLSYWTGDRLHIELSTAKDAPLLTSNSPRSSFGIREAIVVRSGASRPPEPLEHLEPIYQQIQTAQPQSIEELDNCVIEAIIVCIDSWKEEATDSEASLLSSLLGSLILPNDTSALPETKPLIDSYRRLESQRPVPTRVPSLEEAGGSDSPLFIRGDHKQPADLVPRRFLEVFGGRQYKSSLSGRLELAEDMVANSNTLTRRVIVNRIWHHLFGNGIVGTTDNFGKLGTKPTHPKLLDFLAMEFSNHQWSIKRLIKQIVLSKTWQLSTKCTSSSRIRDPDNFYLGRANVRRLDAEAIRDSLLSVSGLIDENMFGPSVASSVPRRSVYTRVLRNNLDPFLRTFDFPEPSKTTGCRHTTNVPAQALALMNDKQVVQYAHALAQRVLESEDQSDQSRIKTLFSLCFSRRPSKEEMVRMTTFLRNVRRIQSQRRVERKESLLKIETINAEIKRIEEPIRQRLSMNTQLNASVPESMPKPISNWDFAHSLSDSKGILHVTSKRSARQTSDGLSLDGNGFGISEPISKSIRAKTLEAWVQLSDLNQKGGGIITIQSSDGAVFDSIVFGEIVDGEWLAGSDHHRRTQRVGGDKESTADKEYVHVAATYDDKGMITFYRNGAKYGKPYKSRAPITYEAGKARIAFGLRHSPAGGNRLMRGQILRARLYDYALSETEVSSSFLAATRRPTNNDLLHAMPPEFQKRHGELVASRASLQKVLDAKPGVDRADWVWSELAHAAFLFREFIFIR